MKCGSEDVMSVEKKTENVICRCTSTTMQP